MAKLLKITGKIIGGTFEWLLILLIVIAFAIRTSPVQTKLAQLATDYLSKELKTEIHIGKVDIYFFDRVGLDDVFVRDQRGDTLASLGSMEVVLHSLDLKNNAVTLSNISLKQGRVGISRDSLTGDYNYFFITDYFDSGKPKRTKTKPMDITVQSLDLNHINITYDDYRKSYSDYGMDYDHLKFFNVYLHADRLEVSGDSFTCDIGKLSAREQCGLRLKRLKTKCAIGDNGIYFTDLTIRTSRSRIYSSHFSMKMNDLKNIRTFVDSVTFDAIIDSGRVSLKDVSYFAPALKGMKQHVYLQARLTQKVKDLKISDIDLRTGRRTVIRGNLLLPDFRSLDGSFLKESVEYAYVDLEDLEALRLPDRVKQHFIELNPQISRLNYFEVQKLNVTGYWSQFVLSGRRISTGLGTVHLDNGLLFTELKEGGYAFERSANSSYDVYIDSFNLGKFIDDPLLGKVNGSLFMGGVVGQQDVIRLTKLDGLINSFGFNGYNYTNIAVTEGSFIDNVFDAKIDIKDPHLELAFDGSVNVNKGHEQYAFTAKVAKADLGKLNVTKDPNASLVTDFTIDMQGTSLSNYRGTVSLKEFRYTEDSNTIDIPDMDLTLTRGATDHVTITSDVADVQLDGKINQDLIATSLNNALSGPLSAYFPFEPLGRRAYDSNFFDLTVNVKQADEVLAVFVPKLQIAPGTQLTMHYDAPGNEATVALKSDRIMYDSIVVRGLEVNQSLTGGAVKAEVNAAYFGLNDSLFVEHVDIDIDGKENTFNTIAKWNKSNANPAEFDWSTTLTADNRIEVQLKPSFFSVKNQKWEIQNKSELIYSRNDNRMEIDHLVLERDVQFIAVNGVLSSNPEDRVDISINQLQLKEFSSFINAKADIEGNVNGDVHIATPFTAFRADGDVAVEGLVVNNEPVGDVSVNGLWDGEKERVVMSGDLDYLKNKTFDFSGYYYPYKDANNIDFLLEFDGMDLQFANAFVPPDVVRDVRGNLEGEIHVTGKAEAPTIDGQLKLLNGNVKIALLGVNYKLNGPIEFDGENSSFYIDNMPVIDEEGNRAFLNASINHTEFKKWNCDIGINIEDDYLDLDYKGAPKPIDKFLVLNTGYTEGEIYYGRAYVTGTANIFVTEDNTNIAVNVQTEEGTWIDIPMYGNSEIEEGNFIHFENKGVEDAIKSELDLSNLDLDLNFDVTPDARVKLIFNDKTGDAITAYGAGQLEIHLDNLNDVRMTGKYQVVGKESKYNFVMGPIKQIFDINEGGSIIWTGSPYNAALNLVASNKVRASLNEITQDVMSNNNNNSQASNQYVLCVMYITQTLDDPLITLDIQAPNASDYGQAVLNSIRSSKEETQKQFFSLLLFKKFAPLAGQASAGTGGIADVITNQLNSILDGVSDEVKLNVSYDGDDITGSKTYKVGSQVALGQNSNIILKTSFGVANSTTESQTSRNVVGDMSLEYLINSDGSFRVNIFNESNETGVIQDKTQGLFTQGVGLHYQEDFNTVNDFKLIQIFFDLFRHENRVKIKKRRHEVKIYPDKKPEPLQEGKPVNETESGGAVPGETPTTVTPVEPEPKKPEEPQTEPTPQ